MIRTVRRGATREALVADLARIEALEAEESWRGVTEPAKQSLRTRIGHLDAEGFAGALRRETLRYDFSGTAGGGTMGTKMLQSERDLRDGLIETLLARHPAATEAKLAQSVDEFLASSDRHNDEVSETWNQRRREDRKAERDEGTSRT